jgi:dTDP-glucose pyrophosphorylase
MHDQGSIPKELAPAVLSPTASVREAMRSLNESAIGIVLIVGDQGVDKGRLLGTVTDGNIRRGLLSDATLDSPVGQCANRQFTAVRQAVGRAEVLDLMRALSIQQIPIVDEQGAVVGLHLLREMIGVPKRPNWGVIMAGGKGTRLHPLTENIPKPMISVAGRPILERLVLHLVGHGIQTIFLAVNYLRQMIEDHFGDGSRFGCRIEYLRESQPLGTGGALALLPALPPAPIVLMNGDLVTQTDISSMLRFHEEGGQVLTVATRLYSHTVPFGCLEIEGAIVRRIEEKPRLIRSINAGIYVLDPELIASIERDTEVSAPELIENCIRDGRIVRAFEMNDDWIDVGQWEQLQQAREGAG